MTDPNQLKDQGIKLYLQHDYEAAGRLFKQAKEIYETGDQADMVAEMSVNIGLVHRSLGENQQALDLMEEALRTFREMGDQLRTAQVLGNLGGVYLALNDKEQALVAYQQAADIFENIGEKTLYSETKLAIAELLIKDGKFMLGALSYQTGLEGMTNLSLRQKIIKRLADIALKFSSTPMA